MPNQQTQVIPVEQVEVYKLKGGEVTSRKFDRVYQNPSGYASYTWPISELGGSTRIWFTPSLRRHFTSGQSSVLTRWHMCGLVASLCDFPLYWVGEEMMPAALATRLPDDIEFTDLKWPRDSMTFILPQKLFSVGNGWIKFVTIARYTADAEYVDNALASRARVMPVVRGFKDFFVVAASHSAGSGTVASYTMTGALGQFEARTQDVMSADTSEYEKMGIHEESIADSVNSIVRLALNLLLISVARPEVLTGGGVAKRIKAKYGVGRRDLWMPRWIGRDWRAKRETPGDGTHASPRMHWRRGHYRNSAYGPKHSLRRIIWIEPMLVNALPKEQTKKPVNVDATPTEYVDEKLTGTPCTKLLSAADTSQEGSGS